MHLLDLSRSRTKRHETHKVYRLDFSPEGPDTDGQESVGLTIFFVFLRDTLEELGVGWFRRQLDLVEGREWWILVI